MASDYISREAAIRAHCDGCVDDGYCGKLDGRYACEDVPNIMAIPAADVVEVVRCKDCKHRKAYKHYCEKGYMNIKAVCDLDSADPYELSRNAEDDDWFCADGERRGKTDDAE